MNTSPLVTILCLVYNHEQYLRQCLEGFVMQKTNFKFEAIVHDDASTDNSASIILEYAAKYPDIIKPIIETENQYLKRDGSLGKIMDSHIHGKYVAYCEGDDYWIDSLKLQKQVEYLEKNPEYVLSYTSYKTYYEDECKYYFYKYKPSLSHTFSPLDVLSQKCGILTLTVVVNSAIAKKVRSCDEFLFSGAFLMGDTQLWYSLAKEGKLHYLPDYTAVYRKHNDSATRGTNPKSFYRFSLSSYEMRRYLCERDDLPSDYQKNIMVEYDKRLYDYLCFDRGYKTMFPLSSKDNVKIRKCLNAVGLWKLWLVLLVRWRPFLGYVKRVILKK